MKTLITYYSYSGNTDRVVKIFADVLRKQGEVDIQRLRPKYEITTFIGQCAAARSHKKAALGEGIKFDVGAYDLILLGCPVWAFAPVPAMNTFLDNLSGASGKRAIVLLTSGSGLGVGLCFKNMRRALEAKGVSQIDEINIPDRKQGDEDFIASALQRVL